jgi:hypothetical protein
MHFSQFDHKYIALDRRLNNCRLIEWCFMKNKSHLQFVQSIVETILKAIIQLIGNCQCGDDNDYPLC